VTSDFSLGQLAFNVMIGYLGCLTLGVLDVAWISLTGDAGIM